MALLILVGLSGTARADAVLCYPEGTVLKGPSAREQLPVDVNLAPDLLPDGLGASTPAASGLAPEPLAEMLLAIRQKRYTKVNAILIASRGKLVLEAYFNGFTRETKHDTRSVFKSFASTLLGIAADRNLITVDQRPVAGYFPDYWPSITVDRARKDRITLPQMLTMSSGLGTTETPEPWPNSEIRMELAEDWIAYSLDLPMWLSPGERFSYHSSTTMLLGQITARAAGETLPAFAEKHLFAPLGITDYCWSLTPKGRAIAQGNFFIRPRDMVKFGQMMLQGGRWQDRQIVSRAWLDEATAFHVDVDYPPPGAARPRNGYGYQWWVRAASNARFDHFFASGNGGQKIYVFPRLEMVVVFTGGHYNQARGHRQVNQLFRDYIIPSIIRSRG